jgi:hypothetical protein
LPVPPTFLQMKSFHSSLWLNIPHFLYPFIQWWAQRLIPWLGYCEQCCMHVYYILRKFLEPGTKMWLTSLWSELTHLPAKQAGRYNICLRQTCAQQKILLFWKSCG